MNNIIILVGPPGSGKSTLAASYETEGYIRVSQDRDGKNGHLRVFQDALDSNKDIVVDRMGFSKAQRDRYLLSAKKKGYSTQIIVLHESYKTCLERCLVRQNHETIKNETNARTALNLFFTKYERPDSSEADLVMRLWPQGYKPSAIICDLDGTLCDVTHRRHFVRREPGIKKDWQGFFKGMVDDVPNKWCSDILFGLSWEHIIVYCSGRPDSWRKQTVEWLKKHQFDNINDKYSPGDGDFHLYMRPRQDSRDDYIVKEIILDFEILTRFTPFFMLDDRKQVVDMWRARGYICLQCDVGNF
jgi:predicted kinase